MKFTEPSVAAILRKFVSRLRGIELRAGLFSARSLIWDVSMLSGIFYCCGCRFNDLGTHTVS
jgi:hypothetical protein